MSCTAYPYVFYAMGYVDIIQGKGTHFKKNISSDSLYLIGLKNALEVGEFLKDEFDKYSQFIIVF